VASPSRIPGDSAYGAGRGAPAQANVDDRWCVPRVDRWLGIMEKFGTAALAASGAPAPAVRLVLGGYTLLSGMAFSPVPADLPLN